MPGFSQWLSSKESACNAEDMGSIPELGRSPEGSHDNPLQYSCLENPMARGALRAIVHGVTKSWTQLKQLSMNTCISNYILLNNDDSGGLIAKSHLTLWDHIHCSPPDSYVHGIP